MIYENMKQNSFLFQIKNLYWYMSDSVCFYWNQPYLCYNEFKFGWVTILQKHWPIQPIYQFIQTAKYSIHKIYNATE